MGRFVIIGKRYIIRCCLISAFGSYLLVTFSCIYQPNEPSEHSHDSQFFFFFFSRFYLTHKEVTTAMLGLALRFLIL